VKTISLSSRSGISLQQRAAGLRDGLDHHDAGHDWVVREVARELGLIDGDVLEGDDARARLDLQDAVDEQQRIAVRQDGHDLDDVHNVRIDLV